ncbi:MAG: hypothetical protein KJ956_14460, partial [Actinobacteria bacterium]|nr:hypothetical protein [Actinomycetota bacterium]
EELVDTACEVAEIYAVNLENYAKALEEVAFVLKERRADRKAVGILEKLLKQDDYRVAAARLIEPHLKPLEKYSQYAWVLQILLEAAEDTDEKRTLYESLAMVYDENLSDTAAAYDTVCKALDEFPTSEKLWARVEQLAERSDRWEDACRKFEELFSDENLDEGARVSLARRLAAIGEQKTGDLDAARKYHKWIFDRNKEDQAAFEALEMIHTNQDQYAELRNLYREKADVTPDVEAKVELLQKIGFINEDMIENRKEAIEIYREIMGLMPSHENANKALERLYEQESMWAELADHIEANLDNVPPEAAVAAKFKLADIVDTKLLDHARAVDYYRQVLDAHPTHLKAQEALVMFLSMDDMKFEAARILEPIYDSQGVYGQLISVLGVRFDGAQTDDDKIDILLKMSDVQERRLKDHDGSFETLSRAFDIDPSREETVTRIESLVESSNYWSIYVDVLDEAAGKAGDNLLKGGMLFKVARIYEERLEDMERAEGAFKKYLDLDLDDREMTLASAASLEKIYAAGERHEELIGMLKLQVEHNETPEARLELLKRIAEIQESLLSRNEDAIRTNIEILEIAPEDFGAITSLRRLYETTQQWGELVSILKRMIDVARETEEKKILQYEVASFYAEKLENAEEAIFTYQLIGEEFGEEIEALGALVKLYEKTGDWAELTATVDRLIGHTEADSEKITLLLFAGNIEKDKMDDLDAAAARCRRVLDLDADNRESLKILEELLSKDMVRLKVAQMLGPVYERNQQFEQLIGILDIEISEEQDFDRKVSLLRRVAEISEIGLGDMGRAFTYYADALRGRLDNAQEAEAIIDDLERITRDSEDYKRLVD